MATIKISSLKKSMLLILILVTMTSNIFAQLREDLRNEILIYIQPSELEFPEIEQKSIQLENIIFLNSELRTVLMQFGITELQKAFPNIRDTDTLAISEDGTVFRIPQMSRIFTIKVPDVNDINSAIDNLSRIRGVLFAEKHSDISLTTDDYYPNQWHLNNTGQTGGTTDVDIDAPEAWQIFNGSSTVKLGVIDTGVEISHDDLTGKSTGDLPESFPYDGYAHGTHVAGISAAKHNNIGKVRGVDANVQVLSKKVFSGYVYDHNCACYSPAWAGDNNAYNKIVQAINEGANVFNNSYGGPDFSTTLRMAFSYAYKMNRTAVVSMMNNNSSTPFYPAAFGQGILAVGSTTHDDIRSTFSNYGGHIDFTAPGSLILSTWRGNGYDIASGTSMAAPIVAGISTLIKGYNPNLYNDDIENIIKLSADKVRQDLYNYNTNGLNFEMGYGRVNAYKALQFLQAPYQLSHNTVSGGSIHSSTNNYALTIYGASGLQDGTYWVKRYEVRKSLTFPHHFDHNVWGRGLGNGVSGWNNDSPRNFAMGFSEIVPGTVTSNTAVVRTYLYEIWKVNALGQTQYLGWYPSNPQNVSFNYTVLGKPLVAPIISHFTQNPNPICKEGTGYVQVHLSQGNGNLTYNWFSYNQPSYVTVNPSGNICYITYHNTIAADGIEAPTWDFGCTVSNGAGQSTAYYSPALDPNCYGCPTLSFDNNGYLSDENPLLITSLNNPGVDVTDYYLINTPVTTTNNKIDFVIHEPQTEHT